MRVGWVCAQLPVRSEITSGVLAGLTSVLAPRWVELCVIGCLVEGENRSVGCCDAGLREKAILLTK